MDADEMIANLDKKQVVNTAGFWKRVFAFIVDLLLLNIIVFSAFSSILSKYFTFESISSFRNGLPTQLNLILILIGIFSFVYFSLLEYGIGQTIGMMMVGIKVNGNLSFWRCTVRNLFIIPIFPLTLFLILDPIYLIIKKKRLSEILTNTDTVYTE